MKNGFFNYIHGIAFCFVLSIICLFGRVDVKADTLSDGYALLDLPSDNFFVSYHSSINKFYLYKFTSNTDLIARDSGDMLYCRSNDSNRITVEKYYCTLGQSTWTYSTTIYGNVGLAFAPHIKDCICYSSKDIYFENGTKFTDYLIEIPNELSYDSTLGYLDNCIRKCMNQVSLRDSNGQIHSFSDFASDKLLGTDLSFNLEGIDGCDCYHWLDKTTSGKSFDSVEVYISLFKEGTLVKENSFILGGHPLYYDVSWRSLDSAISCLDLLTRKYTYQIWLRPLSDNSYGDWVYFDCEYNRVSERIQNLVSHILDGDIIGTIDDFKLTVENCQFGTVQGDYEKPSDVPTSSIVPNVLYNGVYTQLYKPTITDDDKDNILQQIPDSSTSYTEITNNITIIQNGNEDGNSLIDKLGDLLSFCKNFLTFIYNFINLILSPLSFLPSWLKSLLSMSIIAFIVICVLKTVRG